MSLRDDLAGVLARDSRYSIHAYAFLFEAIEFTRKLLGRSPGRAKGRKGKGARHITGRQLCEGACTMAIASKMPAVRIPAPLVLGPPSPSNTTCITGRRKKMPQNPYTTLGTAARSSTRNEPMRRTGAGAISARKAAEPTPIGTAMSIAMADESSVP